MFRPDSADDTISRKVSESNDCMNDAWEFSAQRGSQLSMYHHTFTAGSPQTVDLHPPFLYDDQARAALQLETARLFTLEKCLFTPAFSYGVCI
jgi:hypothetical protein